MRASATWSPETGKPATGRRRPMSAWRWLTCTTWCRRRAAAAGDSSGAAGRVRGRLRRSARARAPPCPPRRRRRRWRRPPLLFARVTGGVSSERTPRGTGISSGTRRRRLPRGRRLPCSGTKSRGLTTQPRDVAAAVSMPRGAARQPGRPGRGAQGGAGGGGRGRRDADPRSAGGICNWGVAARASALHARGATRASSRVRRSSCSHKSCVHRFRECCLLRLDNIVSRKAGVGLARGSRRVRSASIGDRDGEVQRRARCAQDGLERPGTCLTVAVLGCTGDLAKKKPTPRSSRCSCTTTCPRAPRWWGTLGPGRRAFARYAPVSA